MPEMLHSGTDDEHYHLSQTSDVTIVSAGASTGMQAESYGRNISHWSHWWSSILPFQKDVIVSNVIELSSIIWT